MDVGFRGLPEHLWVDSFSILFNRRSFQKPAVSLGFQRVSRKKHQLKAWKWRLALKKHSSQLPSALGLSSAWTQLDLTSLDVSVSPSPPAQPLSGMPRPVKGESTRWTPTNNMAVAQKTGAKMEPWKVETWTKTCLTPPA